MQCQIQFQSSGGCYRADLDIASTAGPQSTSSPFANYANPSAGAYNVKITSTWFEDTIAGHPIFIAPFASGQTINDILISNSVLTGGGVQIGTYVPGAPNFSDHTQCDNRANFADDTILSDPLNSVPRNIRFDHNIFYSPQGAISGYGRYVGVSNNTFHSFYWPSNADGGIIDQETCSDQVKITANHFYGNWKPNWYSGYADSTYATHYSGLELYGRNVTVDGNFITGMSEEAIGVFSTYKASVTGNHLWGNDLAGSDDPNGPHPFRSPHISVATRVPDTGTCSPPDGCGAYRDTEALVIQNKRQQWSAGGDGILWYPH